MQTYIGHTVFSHKPIGEQITLLQGRLQTEVLSARTRQNLRRKISKLKIKRLVNLLEK